MHWENATCIFLCNESGFIFKDHTSSPGRTELWNISFLRRRCTSPTFGQCRSAKGDLCVGCYWWRLRRCARDTHLCTRSKPCRLIWLMQDRALTELTLLCGKKTVTWSPRKCPAWTSTPACFCAQPTAGGNTYLHCKTPNESVLVVVTHF